MVPLLWEYIYDMISNVIYLLTVPGDDTKTV